MRVLLVTEFDTPGAIGWSYWRAFQKIGCQVERFDTKFPGPLWRSRFVRPFSRYPLFALLNARLLRCPQIREADLVFVIKGNYIFPETLAAIRRTSRGRLVNFNPDSPFQPRVCTDWIRRGLPLYDGHFTWSRQLISEIERASHRSAYYLPFGWDPDLLGTAQVKRVEGSPDIVFVGTWTPEREEFVSAVCDVGHLEIWGNMWERASREEVRRAWRGGPVYGKPMARVTSEARIALNLLSPQNRRRGSHNMRTFEIPACGGCMVTSRTVEQCELFGDGVEMVTFGDAAELRSQVAALLADPSRRDSIAERALARVQEHTYETRARTVIQLAQIRF